MRSRFTVRRAAAALALAGCLIGGKAYAQQELVMEPLKDAGLGIYPAYEGWFQNEDGSYSLLIGYYNRNKKQELDVPIGPNNKVEPGGPDQGQPTHFLVGRGWGTFVVKVPKDFGDKKIIWTLTANGKTYAIPFGVTKGYQIEPFKDAAMGNTPPKISFEKNGAAIQGPPPPLAEAHQVSAAAGEPTPLTVFVTDEGPTEQDPAAGGGGPQRPARLSIVMSKYRGPGEIKFDDATPAVKDGQATATATFSLPGEYLIRVEGNDSSGVGGGGFQCCWTTAYIKATVKAGNTGGQ